VPDYAMEGLFCHTRCGVGAELHFRLYRYADQRVGSRGRAGRDHETGESRLRARKINISSCTNTFCQRSLVCLGLHRSASSS
jgi:hypothetical protein